MKLSVSLPDEDVASSTSSPAPRPALEVGRVAPRCRMLRLPELEQDYEAAWQRVGSIGRPGGVERDRGRRDRRCCAVRSGLSIWTQCAGARPTSAGPAVIVSTDRANSVAARLGRGVVTVVPVTSIPTGSSRSRHMLPAAATGLRSRTPRPRPSRSARSQSSGSAPSSGEPQQTSWRTSTTHCVSTYSSSPAAPVGTASRTSARQPQLSAPRS